MLPPRFLILILTLVCSCNCWLNQYDGSLDYACPTNQSVSGIDSEHSNVHLDRIFDIHCRTVQGITEHCHWSGFINNFDELIAYQCPSHGFIHGMRSEHDNGPEDRRWSFYCCERRGMILDECYDIPHTKIQAPFSVSVPINEVVRGVISAHYNHFEDREYVFELCKLIRTSGPEVPAVG